MDLLKAIFLQNSTVPLPVIIYIEDVPEQATHNSFVIDSSNVPIPILSHVVLACFN